MRFIIDKQGLSKLLEPEVEILCLKEDVYLIEGMVKECERKFADLLKETKIGTKMKSKLKVDKKFHLDKEEE